jgi:stringent starvation protein B
MPRRRPRHGWRSKEVEVGAQRARQAQIALRVGFRAGWNIDTANDGISVMLRAHALSG